MAFHSGDQLHLRETHLGACPLKLGDAFGDRLPLPDLQITGPPATCRVRMGWASSPISPGERTRRSLRARLGGRRGGRASHS
jgi:hypothetical protein